MGWETDLFVAERVHKKNRLVAAGWTSGQGHVDPEGSARIRGIAEIGELQEGSYQRAKEEECWQT